MDEVPSLGTATISALRDYEFASFLVGASLPAEFGEREDTVRAEFKLRGGEPMKSELTREVAKAVATGLHRKIRYRHADLTVVLDPLSRQITVRPRSVFVFGRYVKRVRGLPQKRAKCEYCRGHGCNVCQGTGYALTKSVESLLSAHLCALLQAPRARFSWFGGEDAESLVLGGGRPFYAEVFEPRKRSVPPGIRGDVGDGVGLKHVRVIKKPEGRRGFRVTFRVQVEAEEDLDRAALTKLEQVFTARPVQMLSSKRGRMVEKQVYSLKAKSLDGRRLLLRIVCAGGLNVKKFVGGLGEGVGEVTPNLSSTLGVRVVCRVFDVLKVTLGPVVTEARGHKH